MFDFNSYTWKEVGCILVFSPLLKHVYLPALHNHFIDISSWMIVDDA